jgi:hypothetical protein
MPCRLPVFGRLLFHADADIRLTAGQLIAATP